MKYESINIYVTIIINKYSKWYNNIIKRALTRNVEGYTERHHITPKSAGGSNDLNNIVRLYPREHMLCHILLTKFTEGDVKIKMLRAVYFLCHTQKNKTRVSTRLYEYFKKNQKFTEIHCRNISLAKKGTRIGHKQSAETIAKRVAKIKIPCSAEKKAKISATLKGRPCSDEKRAKIIATFQKKKMLKSMLEYIE
jgi:hypothetical protein